MNVFHGNVEEFFMAHSGAPAKTDSTLQAQVSNPIFFGAFSLQV